MGGEGDDRIRRGRALSEPVPHPGATLGGAQSAVRRHEAKPASARPAGWSGVGTGSAADTTTPTRLFTTPAWTGRSRTASGRATVPIRPASHRVAKVHGTSGPKEIGRAHV
mgnify:FL=1